MSRSSQSRLDSGSRENVDSNPRRQGRVLQIFSSQRRLRQDTVDRLHLVYLLWMSTK